MVASSGLQPVIWQELLAASSAQKVSQTRRAGYGRWFAMREGRIPSPSPRATALRHVAGQLEARVSRLRGLWSLNSAQALQGFYVRTGLRVIVGRGLQNERLVAQGGMRENAAETGLADAALPDILVAVQVRRQRPF